MTDTTPVAIERRGATIDAPDAYYTGAHVRVVDRHVVIYGHNSAVHAEYEFDTSPEMRSGGKLVGTVNDAPLVVDKGCGCRNKPFIVHPKGGQQA